MSFIIGLFLGAFIGVGVMCLCEVASKTDDELEMMSKDKDKK